MPNLRGVDLFWPSPIRVVTPGNRKWRFQGEPLRMVTERVAMQGRTLRWLVGRIDRTRPYYLLGEVELADARAQARIATLSSIETYNPAS